MTTTGTIRVNGKDEALATDTLGALLAARGIAAGAKGVAAAVNGRLVTRASWDATALKAGDAVEIVQAKQGG